MQFIIVLSAICAVALAASPIDPVPILSQNSDVNFDGTYQHNYETGNGISAQESGVLKNAGNKDAEAEEVSGSFQYTSPEGTPVQITYIANENGFQPQGAHLPVAPTPPPIPAAIARALEWIAAHPQPQEGQQGGKKF